VWACEIDDFCRKIYAQQFGQEPQGKDIGLVTKKSVPKADLWVGGFPCQDLSVAGRRAGLDGSESGLWWQWLRLINAHNPEWLLIENVPGLLSSGNRRDFQAFLSSLAKAEIPMPRHGKWPDAGLVRATGMEIAWRVLDAQYFGLAQRRRRLFIIRRLGKGGPAEVLFECESRKGHPRPKREAGCDIAASVEGCANNEGGLRVPVAGASAFRNRGTHIRAEASTYVVGALKRRHDGSAGRGGGNPIISHAITHRTHKGGDPTTDQYAIAHTITQSIRKGDDPTKDQLAISFEENQRGEVRLRDIAPTLNAERGGKPGQSYAAVLDRADTVNEERSREQFHAENEMVRGRNENLRSSAPPHSDRVRKGAGIRGRAHRVAEITDRRGTRVWKRGTPDSPRYKALGNAVAVPVIKWIGNRLARYR
jgi:DNA (cytosine-5)-methyltransferase 1